MNKCLIIINRPVHIMYFYSLWVKYFLPQCSEIDFFINQSYLSFLDRFKDIFKLPIDKIYTFEEPVPSMYRNILLSGKNLIINFFKYYRLIGKIKAMDLSKYGYILTFADDMLHFQFFIFNYKKKRKNGIVFLADEGTALYQPFKEKKIIREIFKKIFFLQNLSIPMGCNPLVDIIFARIPEKCNCADSKKIKKIDYQIQKKEDFDRWCKLFGVDINLINSLKKQSNKKILFLGIPFEEINIPHNKIIEFLCIVKELEKSDIIVKPHPKESISFYKEYFNILPANLPPEILFSRMSFKFVLGYYSSALIEASLYKQKTYYFNLPNDINDNDSNYCNLKSLLQGLGVEQYIIKNVKYNN